MNSRSSFRALGANKGAVITYFTLVLLYVCYTIYAGGSALNGRIGDKHFYVSSGADFVEVPRHVYIISALTAILATIGFFGLAYKIVDLLGARGVFRERPGLRFCLLGFFGLVSVLLCAFATLAFFAGVTS